MFESFQLKVFNESFHSLFIPSFVFSALLLRIVIFNLSSLFILRINVITQCMKFYIRK